MINKTTILLIQNDIQALSELTQKCLEAGISERNIFSVTETESAQRYLEIAGISYVIIDADMYNYVIASTISEFSEYFPIQPVITNAKPEQKTLRMMSDKSLTFLNCIDELPALLQEPSFRGVSYTSSNATTFQNL